MHCGQIVLGWNPLKGILHPHSQIWQLNLAFAWDINWAVGWNTFIWLGLPPNMEAGLKECTSQDREVDHTALL